MHPGEIKRERLAELTRELFQVEDLSGIQLIGSIARAAQLAEMLDNQTSDDPFLSGPRWRLMLVLYLKEHIVSPDGMTPTELSRFQRVSRNTISALLRGLEAQGLIRRETDPSDLRIFRIRLTDAGRQMIRSSAPRRIENLNRILSGLTPEEIAQLARLLDKLGHSMHGQLRILKKEMPAG